MSKNYISGGIYLILDFYNIEYSVENLEDEIIVYLPKSWQIVVNETATLYDNVNRGDHNELVKICDGVEDVCDWIEDNRRYF